ncbi:MULTISPECIES: ABC transporter ATP-binding protein [unclassified Pseudoalteromonas]|uniref:ABC transporter ATP-binding protein n=1 Tax=unclassified Pseudoalteromonas TaxID=194690 RepID=UPI0005AB8B92|nr:MULTISPECIES: ABC transporter ATP-binding protein [unclassified Pseudoalteromonas]
MIVLKNINKKFKNGKLHVLKDINLEIMNGEFVTICGPSGHGKSTLLTILAMLDQADTGMYTIEDIDVSKLTLDKSAKVRSKHIGIIFQSFNLIGDYTVKENVMLPLKYSPHISTAVHEQVFLKAMKDVGLEDKINEYPSNLSGGQQQRVAIARALVTSPSIIFADEPTGNLDSKNAQKILELLKTLNNDGVTVCMVTHDQNIATQSDRIINIHDGVVKADSSERNEVCIIKK